MVKTYQDVVGEQCVKNDGMLPVIHEDKNLTWKNYEKLLITEFAWDGNSLSQTDKGGVVPQLIYKDVVREAISKKKNSKAEEPARFV